MADEQNFATNLTQSSPAFSVVNDVTSLTNFSRMMCILVLRAGFILIQVGSIPINNVFVIIQYSIIDIAISILSYLFAGYTLSFGETSYGGFIAWGGYIWDDDVNTDRATLGLAASLIASAIVSTYVIGRVRYISMFIITMILCGFYQPMMMHICWAKNGFLAKPIFKRNAFVLKDYRGCMVIFIPAAVVGLMCTLILGRRLVKLEEADEFSLGDGFASGAVSGYILVMIGLIGLFLPAHADETPYTDMILLNTLIALSVAIVVSGLMTFYIHCTDTFYHSLTTRCAQGGIAGIVVIASGVNIYTPIGTICIAAAGAIVFYFMAIVMYHSSIEDPCNITAAFLICAIFGFVFEPFVEATQSGRMTVLERFEGVLWQFTCFATITAVTVIFFGLVILFFWAIDIFRTKWETYNHERAVYVENQLPKRKRLKRLFRSNPDDNIYEIERDRNSSRQNRSRGVNTTPRTMSQPRIASQSGVTFR